MIGSLIRWLAMLAMFSSVALGGEKSPPVAAHFDRIATYDVTGEVAEIVGATPDGKLLAYTDSDAEEVGLVDITNPEDPRSAGSIAMPGEPTSLAVTRDGRFVLVAVEGSPDVLVIADLATRVIRRTMPLPGQPDSVAIGPTGRYAAIAIENERDEDFNDGAMPQAPAGLLTIVDLSGEPEEWTTRDVSLIGYAQRFPEDPEPEFVDINSSDIAAVTLQENNYVVLVDLAGGAIVDHWSVGTTSHAADTVRDGEIRFDGMLNDARREPDAIAWTPGGRLVTANEGDYDVALASGEFVGGRDFTLFSSGGDVLYEPGDRFERQAVLHGHYPDSRSAKKGAEPEGVETGGFEGRTYLFVGSERGDFVAVYRLNGEEETPEFLQLLPTGDEPEGLLAIGHRRLFVTANEGDGTISIFRLVPGLYPRVYPEVISESVPWSALSGLAAGPGNTLYAVPDNAFAPSRIFTIHLGKPARIVSSLVLPKTYDPEGIATAGNDWWIVSEGRGNFGQPGLTRNLLVRIEPDGTVAQEVELPSNVNDEQKQFGFEGVAASSDGSEVYIVFQREWADDPAGRVKIGRYTPATGEWRFFHYPLDEAPAGGWVGLSEITAIDDTTFAVAERDNQQRDEALVKRVYRISVAGIEPAPAGQPLPLLEKTLLRDLLAEDGWRLEKLEGMALTRSDELVLVNDNDGAGETRLLRLRGLF